MTQPIRPSEVTDWLRCPQLHQYKHVEQWQPPASTWSPERLIGSAIHAGLAAFWRPTEHLGGNPQALREVFQAGWPEDAPLEFSREGTEAHALKVLDAVYRWIVRELPDAEPLLIEHTLRADGCTPDLVTREPIGLVVTDWKYHHNVPSDRIHYRLEGLDRTHQFQDYIWQVGEYLHEPVRLFRKVAMIGGPRITVKAGEFMPTLEGTAQWLRGAQEVWQQMGEMKAGTRAVYQRSETGCKPFGAKWPCPMWEACWTCYGDREKMAQFYVKETRANG
jgi:hypothetical protein